MSNGTPTTEMASAIQVAEMRTMIKKVRDVIARFHRIRRQNNERAAGLRASMIHPQQVQEMLRTTRNPELEAQAVDALRQFITVLGGREPTREEMQQGIPEGYEDRVAMTGIPFAVAAVALALGGSVYSYFHHLDTIEEGNQQRIATPLERGLQALSDNIWGVAAVGAIVLGGAIYWQSSKSSSERQKAEIEKYKAAGRVLGKSIKESGSESFTDKVKSVLQNAVFPPEKNPDLTPAERLAKQLESLNEEEQEKFFSIVDGEEPEPEESEEEVEENDSSDESETESDDSDDEESEESEPESEESEEEEGEE